MDSRSLHRSLARIVEPAMAEFQVPGVAVGVSEDGTDRVFGFGVTNIDFPLDVDGDTLFMIGSTTKTVTGTVIMRLVEKGKVALEAPVVEYLPRFRVPDENVANSVSVDHLLTHTSGWFGDYFDDLGRGNDAMSRIVARMARRAQQLTSLGETWSYNNAGFYVLGRIIETITKRPFEDVVRDWVFDPLGMERSCFFAEDVMTRKHALGHSRGSKGPEVMRPWGLSRASVAAGGIVSTARDQLRYARFHMGNLDLGDATPPIGPALVAKMQRPRARAGGLADQVGVTWLLEGTPRSRVVGHGGSINGQMSAFKMLPAQHLAVTVLTNGQLGDRIGSRVSDWVLAELGGVSVLPPKGRKLTRKAAEDYVGRYRGDPGHLVVRFDDGALEISTELRPELVKERPDLLLQLPGPARFVPGKPKDSFVAVDGGASRRVEFIRDPSGEVVWMRWGGRLRPVRRS